MMTILYEVENNLYLNITNRCPCHCLFCIRRNGERAYGSEPLWLDREPTTEEIINELANENLEKYDEIVFCGFGEPLERINTVIDVCKYLKKIKSPPIRINTNGLADLIHKKPVAHMLEGLVDIISISLNAGTEDEYMRVTQPRFTQAFDAVLKFTEDCKKYIPKIQFSVVDVISKEQINLAKNIADRMGIPLRVRKYIK